MTTAQASNGKWWLHLDGDASFDPNLITHETNGQWVYDGSPNGSIVGPFDSRQEAESFAAADA